MNGIIDICGPALETPATPLNRPRVIAAYAPLFVMPLLAAHFFWRAEPFLLMWSLAISIYAGCKWLTWLTWLCAERRAGPLWQSLGYLLLWPGMDARLFFQRNPRLERPACGEWCAATLKIALGAALAWGLARHTAGFHALAPAWTAGVGYVLLLHCGLFHGLSLLWRNVGVGAQPIMNAPLKAQTLGDLWSRRWNRAFSQLAHDYIQRPLARRWGLSRATLVSFFISGLIHDLLISVPAGGGYGLPTLYFTLQGAALLAQRSKWAARHGLERGAVGRALTLAALAAPAFWLFHPAFMYGVMLPFLRAIRAL